MSADRSSGWGNLAVLFAVLTLGAVCVNARAGWRADTFQELGAAFATTGGPVLAVGALLTGVSALSARRLGGREAVRANVAGALLVLAVAVHASLAVAALTRDDPAADPRPFELRVVR